MPRPCSLDLVSAHERSMQPLRPTLSGKIGAFWQSPPETHGSPQADIGSCMPARRFIQPAGCRSLWHRSCPLMRSPRSLKICQKTDHLTVFGLSFCVYDWLGRSVGWEKGSWGFRDETFFWPPAVPPPAQRSAAYWGWAPTLVQLRPEPRSSAFRSPRPPRASAPTVRSGVRR
jgi:hypothetical protein